MAAKKKRHGREGGQLGYLGNSGTQRGNVYVKTNYIQERKITSLAIGRAERISLKLNEVTGRRERGLAGGVRFPGYSRAVNEKNCHM